MTIEDSTLLLFKPFLLGYCSCNCGKVLCPWDKWDRLRRFIPGHNMVGKKGHNANNYKNGIRSHGVYTLIHTPNHLFADKKGCIYLHRLSLEKHLSEKYGREIYILPYFDVHHIDEDPNNNDPLNLMMVTKAEHNSIHKRINFDGRRCSNCDSIKTRLKARDGRPEWRGDGNGGYHCATCADRRRQRERNK